MSKPVFFSSSEKFRLWLEKHHTVKTELWVGYYKVGTGKPSLTWPQSVDEALCYGWIDGIRKSIDGFSYMIRFTPRKSTSIWSAVNMKKVQALTTSGKITQAGLDAFEKRTLAKSQIYSFEQKEIALGKKFKKELRSNRKAWTYFNSQPPSYQRAAIWWVIRAKQEQTKLKRLNELILDSENEQRIKSLRRAG